MLYEIINPSDAYTMEADDFKIAAVANLIIGEGQYGLEPVGGEGPGMPVLFLGGAEEWLDKNVCPVNEFGAFINAHREEIARALDSVIIGRPNERKLYFAGLEMAGTPEKKKAWRDKWHDEKRSSLNDIGSFAWRKAEALRKKKE
jgi:hypothetical protein